MCDTLCIVGSAGTLFAKNSDRPPGEAQVVESFGRRSEGGRLRAQYLELPDRGAHALVGSRPHWLWGLEHGVNEHGVAIGNEKVWTTDDARSAPDALIGMDLVRLGLEQARTADEAIDVMTELLGEHGQGGSGELDHFEPYFSSFLIADPHGGWMLETSGSTWAARRIHNGAAISNRISLGRDWDRASEDVPADADFQAWRDPKAPVAIADRRLAFTERCVAVGAGTLHTREAVAARDLVATLRHHGDRPWGAPGAPDSADISPVPLDVDPEWNGITVCMHVRDYQATTASMVAFLPATPGTPLRAWVALGSPCASVYVPVFPPFGVPEPLGRVESWNRFAALRDRVESDPGALGEVRTVLAPVEGDLWARADELVAGGDVAAPGHTRAQQQYVADAWDPVDAALHTLGV